MASFPLPMFFLELFSNLLHFFHGNVYPIASLWILYFHIFIFSNKKEEYPHSSTTQLAISFQQILVNYSKPSSAHFYWNIQLSVVRLYLHSPTPLHQDHHSSYTLRFSKDFMAADRSSSLQYFVRSILNAVNSSFVRYLQQNIDLAS